MSTRASAPRCASCGMPLAPDATSCAVCGARVPLIARTTADAGDDAASASAVPGAPGGALPSDVGPVPRDGGTTSPEPSALGPRPPVPAAPPVPRVAPTPSGATSGSSAAPPPVDPASSAASAPVTPQRRVDATAAARTVRAAGRPAGAGAVPQGVAAAPPAVGRRVAAYAIDLALAFAVGLVGYLLGAVTGLPVTGLTVALGAVVGVGQIVAEGLRGATLGAHLLGLRTVDDRTGAAPGVPRAFLRQLVVALGMPVCLVGNWVIVASAAWDREPARRGWHDKASGTRVVRAGASPAATASGTASGTAVAGYRSPSGAPRPVPAQGVGAVPAADALYAPPPAPDRRGPVPPPPVGPVAPPPPAPAPDLVAEAPRSPRPADRPERPAADLLPPPPTVGRGPGASNAAQPPAVPESFGVTADDDLAELEHTRVRHPDSLRRRTGTLALSFDTGERVRVVGRGLVGRGPRAEDGEDILHVVALQDAGRSLSRVHAEFGPQEAEAGQDAAIWVADRGSTNGTVVVDPDGVARVLPAGTPAVVRAGWTVRLGDREVRVEDD